MVLGQLGYIILLGNCTIVASSMAALRPTRSAFETEMQADGPLQLQIIWIPTGKMTADIMTKLKIKSELKQQFTDNIQFC
jgi:hypothetical protein